MGEDGGVGIGRSATYNTHGLKLWNKFTMQGRNQPESDCKDDRGQYFFSFFIGSDPEATRYRRDKVWQISNFSRQFHGQGVYTRLV